MNANSILLVWYPRSDITLYELAWLVRYAAGIDRPTIPNYEQWPAEFRRHFQIVYDPANESHKSWVEKYGPKL